MEYEELSKSALTINGLKLKLEGLSRDGFGKDHICLQVNGNVCYADSVEYEDGDFVIKAIIE